eukprot:SAG22_NODE_4319_length_1306_cov_0.870754_2_plen_115_part_00
MCGEFAPLVPYQYATEVYTNRDGETSPKVYNVIWDLSYPSGASGKRSRTPDAAVDGVWNFTMVQSTCTVPVQPLMWKYNKGDDGAMGWLDWVALLLCSYVVGLQVVGEIKDTSL